MSEIKIAKAGQVFGLREVQYNAVLDSAAEIVLPVEAVEIWGLYFSLLAALDRCREDVKALSEASEEMRGLGTLAGEVREWLADGAGKRSFLSLFDVVEKIPADARLRRDFLGVVRNYGRVLEVLQAGDRPVETRCRDVIGWVREVPGGLWLRLEAAGISRPARLEGRFADRVPYRQVQAAAPHDPGDLPVAA